MGRPVAFRAAAILGYPREVQPRFRMKRPKVISGLSSNLPPPREETNAQKRRDLPCTQSCTHTLGGARHKPSGSQDTPRPWGRGIGKHYPLGAIQMGTEGPSTATPP